MLYLCDKFHLLGIILIDHSKYYLKTWLCQPIAILDHYINCSQINLCNFLDARKTEAAHLGFYHNLFCFVDQNDLSDTFSSLLAFFHLYIHRRRPYPQTQCVEICVKAVATSTTLSTSSALATWFCRCQWERQKKESRGYFWSEIRKLNPGGKRTRVHIKEVSNLLISCFISATCSSD